MNDRIADPAQRVRTYLDAVLAGGGTPGIQYLVVDSARTVFEYAGGWADLAHRVPMDTGTTLMGYSMSKTITAAAVLQLVEQGRVRLDDPVSRYVDFNPYGSAITVRQLLSHTSGIPNPIPLRWVHLTAAHGSFDEGTALRLELQRHPELASDPGIRYRYSNIGYWLLGSIVEHAGGEPFATYVTNHVFRPLGAAPGELGYEVVDTARHASGYLEKYSVLNLLKGFLLEKTLIGEYSGRWLRIQSHYPNGPAFGGIVGNARGFGRFLQDQLRAQSVLFGPETRALFYEAQATRDGRTVPMTLGWHVGSAQDAPFFFKEGGGGGFHVLMRVYPAERLATVVMTNATGFDVKGLLDTADPQFVRAQPRRAPTQ